MFITLMVVMVSPHMSKLFKFYTLNMCHLCYNNDNSINLQKIKKKGKILSHLQLDDTLLDLAGPFRAYPPGPSGNLVGAQAA